MFLTQMRSLYNLESINNNISEWHEKSAELRKGGKRRNPAERTVLEATVANNRKSGQKEKKKLSNAGGKEDLEDLQPNDQREHISHAEQAVFNLRHEVLHFF
jgi:hypothetical protein